jgi:hypothetical protein
MCYVLKTIFITVYLFLLCILAFSCISYNSTINTEKCKSFVEVCPIEGNPIEVYPIEAYLIGKGIYFNSYLFKIYNVISPQAVLNKVKGFRFDLPTFELHLSL